MGGRGVDDSTPSLFPGQGPTRVTTNNIPGQGWVPRAQKLRSPLGDRVTSGSQRGPALTQAWVPLPPPQALKPSATELPKCCVQTARGAEWLPCHCLHVRSSPTASGPRLGGACQVRRCLQLVAPILQMRRWTGRQLNESSSS